MGIVSAIARVRAGAKSAGLEGALNSLGAELKSDAIPGRLRDVAGRLAALLDRNQVATAQAPVVVASLERALDQQVVQRAAHASVSAHGAAAPDAVCPFTGLRADEVGASAAATTTVKAVEPAAAVLVAPTETAAVTAPDRAPRALEQPIEPTTGAVTDGAEASAPASSAGAKRRRAGVETGTREKRKERLAGSASVANTSGRSATRPAAKRPRSRAEGTRKKK